MEVNKSKGATTIPIMAAVSVIFVWCAGLSTAIYNVYGTTSGLTSSVGDIKGTLDKADLPNMKAELDFLAAQRGYKPAVRSMASTTTESVSVN